MANTFDQAILNKSRLDKFVMVFDIPPILRSLNKSLERNNLVIQRDSLQFSVFGTVVPQIQVPSIQANYSGSALKLTSNARPAYPPVNVNFTIDNEFNNYWVIYTWLNALRDAKTGLYATAVGMEDNFSANMLVKDYATDISIFGKDEFNEDIIKWTYKFAFPTNLGEISFNYRTSGEIETSFQFEFTELSCELL